jgi:hypothetical protein
MIGVEEDDVRTREYVMQMASEGKLRDPIFVYYRHTTSDTDGGVFYNAYLNEMHNVLVQFHTGFVTYLDDDDQFQGLEAAQKLMEPASDPKVKMLIGKAYIGGGVGILPSKPKVAIQINNISGLGWAFHTDLLDSATWRTDKDSNWEVARNIYVEAGGDEGTRWVNHVVARTQRVHACGGFGSRMDLDEEGVPDHEGLA